MIKRRVRAFAKIWVLLFMVTHVTQGAAQGTVFLPLAGEMVGISPVFSPCQMKGLRFLPGDGLRYDFLIDAGDSGLNGDALRKEAGKLIRYFLASLTTPAQDLWVNLSPYEGDRIIPQALGDTEMGRDLLAQDYILKQITASLLYPHHALGKKFWERVYAQAQAQYGTTDIAVETFHKIWIVPASADIVVRETGMYVADTRLQLMLEKDYVAARQGAAEDVRSTLAKDTRPEDGGREDISTQIMREVVLPELEREVNEGKNFAAVRQIYSALVVAAWFKKSMSFPVEKEAGLRHTLAARYIDRQLTGGIEHGEKNASRKIWERYVEAFQKGVFDFIQEEEGLHSGEIIPRKYFSGGVNYAMAAEILREVSPKEKDLENEVFLVRARLDPVGDRESAMEPPGASVRMPLRSQDRDFVFDFWKSVSRSRDFLLETLSQNIPQDAVKRSEKLSRYAKSLRTRLLHVLQRQPESPFVQAFYKTIAQMSVSQDRGLVRNNWNIMEVLSFFAGHSAAPIDTRQAILAQAKQELEILDRYVLPFLRGLVLADEVDLVQQKEGFIVDVKKITEEGRVYDHVASLTRGDIAFFLATSDLLLDYQKVLDKGISKDVSAEDLQEVWRVAGTLKAFSSFSWREDKRKTVKDPLQFRELGEKKFRAGLVQRITAGVVPLSPATVVRSGKRDLLMSSWDIASGAAFIHAIFELRLQGKKIVTDEELIAALREEKARIDNVRLLLARIVNKGYVGYASTNMENSKYVIASEMDAIVPLEGLLETREGTPEESHEGMDQNDAGRRAERAMANPGGIDLNTDKVKMNIEENGVLQDGRALQEVPAVIWGEVQGFQPVILNIESAQSVRVILGLAPERESYLKATGCGLDDDFSGSVFREMA